MKCSLPPFFFKFFLFFFMENLSLSLTLSLLIQCSKSGSPYHTVRALVYPALMVYVLFWGTWSFSVYLLWCNGNMRLAKVAEETSSAFSFQLPGDLLHALSRAHTSSTLSVLSWGASCSGRQKTEHSAEPGTCDKYWRQFQRTLTAPATAKQGREKGHHQHTEPISSVLVVSLWTITNSFI